jgi:hypothetical protein
VYELENECPPLWEITTRVNVLKSEKKYTISDTDVLRRARSKQCNVSNVKFLFAAKQKIGYFRDVMV